MQQIVFKGKVHQVSNLLDGFTIKETAQSSNVALFAVNQEKNEFFVMFKNGFQYFYNEVDPELLHQALHAESIGKFVSREIVKKFTSTKIFDPIFKEIGNKAGDEQKS